MKIFCLFILFLFSGSLCFGQSVEVASHYPASAFVINRLLPFVVNGPEGLRVLRVEVGSNNSCSSLVDPFYANTFHLYCRESGRADLVVQVIDGEGEETSVELQNLAVVVQRPPSDGMESAFREASGSGAQ